MDQKDYNPFYDNSFQANYGQQAQQLNYTRPLQMSAKNVLLNDDSRQNNQIANQILNQVDFINQLKIETKETKKKQEKLAQWDYERNIQKQDVVYFQPANNQKYNTYKYKNVYMLHRQATPYQNQGRNQYAQNTQPLQDQREVERQSYIPQTIKINQVAQGGIFAGIFDQRDLKEQQKQALKQAYADEIQSQIQEKKKKKDDEARLKFEEDIRYEQQVKKDLEQMKLRFQREDEKKQYEIKSLMNVQEQRKQDNQSKELGVTRNKKGNIIMNNNENYSKILNESNDPTFHREEIQEPDIIDQTIPLGNMSHQNIIPTYLQESVDYKEDQNSQWRELNQISQKSVNRQQYPQSQQNQNQYKHAVSLEKYMQNYEEVVAQNRQKALEQESEIQNLRYKLDQEVSVLANNLRSLKVDEQVAVENKRNAFYELDNLREELKRQELREQQKLQQVKQYSLDVKQRLPYRNEQGEDPDFNYQTFKTQMQNTANRYSQPPKQKDDNIGYTQQFVTLNSGARMMGVPSYTENIIEGRFLGFQENVNIQASVASL